jgi:hypothetical protein
MAQGDAPRRVLRDILLVLVVLGVPWLLFTAVDAALPYIRPGAEVVYDAKTRAIAKNELFDREALSRVVIFGNSKVLTGFQPRLFNELSRGQVSAYNLGLPDYLLFVDNLQRLCERGERPTHVLLMFSWPEEPERTRDIFHPGIEDSWLMGWVFPFRNLPRNLILTSLRSRSRGGFWRYYEDSREQVKVMLEQKGFYFIEGQSHYSGHRLPESFSLQKDDPKTINARTISTDAEAFTRLYALIEKYDIRVIFVPAYYRVGEFALAPPVPDSVAKLAPYRRFTVLGPDYWLLPNKYFSDPVHLNPEGAEFYTRKLWSLVGRSLLSPTDRAAREAFPNAAPN